MQDVAAGLVGRSRELAALDELAATAANGRFRFALVEGEPGIGKTSLLHAMMARARERGAAVAEGAGAELESGTAFAPLLEAFRALPEIPAPQENEIRELLLTAGPDADPAALRFRVVERFVELVEMVVLQRPLVLCLDDAQWADDGTMAVLGRLPRRFAFAPLALVVARRTSPPSPHVDALVGRLPPSERLDLRLRPLDEQEVTEVATQALAARPGPRLQDRLRRAGGNPLLVVELLAALARDEAIEFERGIAETPADELPVSLSAVVRRRVSRLPADALELVRVAAVLGPSFTLTQLRAAAGQPPSRLAPALGAALEEGVLEERDGGVAFRHHLIRDVIHDELPASVRRTLHLGVADALVSLAAPAAQVAAHLEAAAELGEARAVEWLRRAAGESASPAAALDYLERALLLSATSPGERDEVRAELAQALLWAGHPAEAEAAARELLPRVREASRAALVLRVLFRALLVQGRAADLVELAEAQFARLSERDLGLLLAEMAYLLTEARQEPPAESASSGPVPHGTWKGLRASQLAEQALAIGQRLGDASTICLSLCALSSVLDTEGRFAEAAELSRQAVSVADDAPDDEAQRHAPHFHLALQLVLGDRLSEAEGVIVAGLARAEAAGVVWVLPLHHHLLARVHFGVGSWDEARADWETALALADEVGTQMIVADAAQAFLAQIALHRGDLKRAEAHAAAAADAARVQDGAGVSAFALWARALVAEARGDLDEAATAAAEVHRIAAGRRWLALYRLVGVDAARITAAAGQPGIAREVAAAMDKLAVHSRSGATGAAARLARGHAEGDPRILVASVEAYRRSELAFECASALEAAGGALRGIDDEKAGELLVEALQTYERIGATRLSTRVEGLLRAIGRAPRRRGRPRREGIGWESLTDAERRVAALVAQGLSNAQVAESLVISPRTVQTHVAHIFTKLGMTNRAQLAAEAAIRAS